MRVSRIQHMWARKRLATPQRRQDSSFVATPSVHTDMSSHLRAWCLTYWHALCTHQWYGAVWPGGQVYKVSGLTQSHVGDVAALLASMSR